MGSTNQTYEGPNPNMKNYSFSAPEGWMLMIDLLVEWGVFQSRSEILRDAVRRVLWENIDIIKHLKGVIKYVPTPRKKHPSGKKKRTLSNGYIIMNKGMNED